MSEHLEDFVFIWLTSITKNIDADKNYHIERFQEIFNTIHVFDDVNMCVEYILSIPEEIIFLRLGQGWSHLVAFLDGVDQVQFIYSSDSMPSYTHEKLRGTFLHHNDLYHQITKDIRLCESRLTHLTACEDRRSRLETSTRNFQENRMEIVWSQLLLKLLIAMPSSKNATYKNLLDEACRYYQHNPMEMRKIREFQLHYSPNDAIRWYTRDSFVSKMINKALRTRNIVIIFKFRSLLQDIHKQLKNLQEFQGPLKCEMILFRGQFITANELIQLEKNIGNLVALNTFVSTTVDRDVVTLFLKTEASHSRFKSVIFEYMIDPSESLSDLPPFANIKHLSQMPDESEVLLSVGMIARIESITADKLYPQVSCIHLRLCAHRDPNIEQYQSFLFDCLAKKAFSETIYISQILSILTSLGEYEKVKQLSTLLPKSSDPSPDAFQSLINALANLFCRFVQSDDVDSMKPEIHQFLNALQTLVNNPHIDPSFRVLLAPIVTNLLRIPFPGERNEHSSQQENHAFQQLHQHFELVHRVMSTVIPFRLPTLHLSESVDFLSHMKNSTNSLESYNQLQSAYENILGKQHPSYSLNLLIMGDKAQRLGDNDRAIELFQQVIDCSSVSSFRARALYCLASLHHEQRHWSALLKCCQDLIHFPSLPANSMMIVEAYNWISDILWATGQYLKCLHYSEYALRLYYQHHSLDDAFVILLKEKTKVLRQLINMRQRRTNPRFD